VLAVGDMQFQEKCFKKINDLGKSLKTVLFVTHNINAIINLCNKGILFEKGQIKFQGSITDCANEYLGCYRQLTSRWLGDAGDEHLRIRKVYLDSLGEAKEFFSAEDKVQLNIEYEVFSPAKDILLGFSIFNVKGQLLAHSYIGDESSVFHSFSEKGRRRLSFLLPLQIFRDDEYVIHVSYSRGKKEIVTDQISVKLPIVSPNKTVYSMRNAPIDGVFLGGGWVLE
jgi:lipopolysaccharide transport system ATP-binding protein